MSKLEKSAYFPAERNLASGEDNNLCFGRICGVLLQPSYGFAAAFPR